MLHPSKASLISPHSKAESKRDMQMVSGFMYITPANQLLQNHCWNLIQVLASQQASNVVTYTWYNCKINTLFGKRFPQRLVLMRFYLEHGT
ncbi:hypothetical protein PDJAM_G00139260, partial [Pangasius djambal]|nr:hypothetical protein [Pangasius djambal]